MGYDLRNFMGSLAADSTIVDLRPGRVPDLGKIESDCHSVWLTGETTPAPAFTVTPAPPPTPNPTIVDMRPAEKVVASGTLTLDMSDYEPSVDYLPPLRVTRLRARARSRRRARRSASHASTNSGGDPPGPRRHGDRSPRSKASNRSVSP
jgi:hypothetical protein